jgi:hypothetical protein
MDWKRAALPLLPVLVMSTTPEGLLPASALEDIP